jgi:hypothetical protein
VRSFSDCERALVTGLQIRIAGSGFLVFGGQALFSGGFLDDVGVFMGIENFAAIDALNVLRVFLASDDTHFGMLANRIHGGVFDRYLAG